MNIHLSFILLLHSLLFFFSSLPSSSLADTVQRCHPNDLKVLMKIKKSFNNPYHLSSWVPKTDCCDWYNMECDQITNRVTGLYIFSNSISGQIPSSVGDLTYLNTIVLRKLPNLTGSIPSSIVKLKNLKMLRLSWNNLSGPIPDFLGQISSLDYLDLAFNQFSGSIPPSLSNLKNLMALHLDRNKLTGSIPESFGNFNSSPIPDLYLSHNQLSGPIPKSLSNVDFGRIDLSRNKLEGDGSVLFNPERTTTSIYLSRNQLEFDLTNVRFPVNITNLDLSHNKITGMISEQMKSLELYRLNVSYNRLCGEIPFGGKMQRFDYSTYFHNKCLCGSPLPACRKI